MNQEKQTVISILNESYSFSSISGKNNDFISSVSSDMFFFRESAAASHMLGISAGGEITYTIPVRYTQARLPYAILSRVKSGEGSLNIEGNQISSGDVSSSDSKAPCILSAGDILFLPYGTACSFTTARTPFTYDIFYLTGDLLSDYDPFICGESGFFCRSHSELDGVLGQLIDSLLAYLPKDDSLSLLHISAMLHLVLSSLGQSAAPEPNTVLPTHVAQMKALFDTAYQNPHPLAELEATFGISRYRLCHDFSKSVGQPPLQYLNQNRIRAARHLLRSTSLTIHEVGIAVGIENTTHFINLFKKSTGITPLQFRQTSLY